MDGSLHLNLISTLSGGQKARVVFASLQVLSPHLLLLDEPTNHLDIESIEALVDAISKYDGAVMIVTHDVELITNSGCIPMELKNGKLHKIEYEEYEERILNEIDGHASNEPLKLIPIKK